MNESLPCPGCSTPLTPEATGCHICLRARTKQEIVRGYTLLRESSARRRRLPFKLAAAVLIAGAAGKLLWDHRGALDAAAVSARARSAAWYDQFTDPKNYAPHTAGSAEPSPPESKSPLATPIAVPAEHGAERPQASAPGAAQASPDAKARPAGPKPPVAKNAWRVSGTVYDLSSLNPVPNADVTFSREGKDPVTARTDDRGAYEADLVKGDGWTVSARAPGGRDAQLAGLGMGWRRGQILDVDPPYRERDADERQAAIDQISDGDLAPAPVGWKRSASKVRLDLVVVPARSPR